MSDRLPTVEDLTSRSVTQADWAAAREQQAAAENCRHMLRYAADRLRLAGLTDLGNRAADLASDAQAAAELLADVLEQASGVINHGRSA